MVRSLHRLGVPRVTIAHDDARPSQRRTPSASSAKKGDLATRPHPAQPWHGRQANDGPVECHPLRRVHSRNEPILHWLDARVTGVMQFDCRGVVHQTVDSSRCAPRSAEVVHSVRILECTRISRRTKPLRPTMRSSKRDTAAVRALSTSRGRQAKDHRCKAFADPPAVRKFSLAEHK